jgi:hypothetical protein
MRAPFLAVGIRIAAATMLIAACSPARVIVLNPEGGAPLTQPLDVVARTLRVEDPLPVKGESVGISNIAPALGHFVKVSLQGWADKHRQSRPGGWELLVVVTRAHAAKEGGQLLVELDADFTLSGEVGRVYLAQTSGHCREAAPIAGSDPARVMYACMQRLGHDLAGWMEGVTP